MIKKEMMFNYPFFPVRNRNYFNRYYNYPYYSKNYNIPHQTSYQTGSSDTKNKAEPIAHDTEKNETEKEKVQFLSILGIHLYFDDLIILALLFFLYKEGAQDEGLFICLILLLLS